MYLVSELRPESLFEYNGFAHKVVRREIYSPAEGKTLVKLKTFNLDTGESLNYTLEEDIKINNPETDSVQLKFVGRRKNFLIFKDDENGEVIEIKRSLLGENNIYLQDNSFVTALYYRNMFACLELPKVVSMEVEFAEDIEKDSGNSDYIKDARLSNGQTIKVPSFIKTGDKVMILLDNGEYIRRES
jgi:elongation factor P